MDRALPGWDLYDPDRGLLKFPLPNGKGNFT